MLVLLSDVSSCCNDLGRILYTNPDNWNVHMNIVATNVMSSFFTSHTEYQMSVCVSVFLTQFYLTENGYNNYYVKCEDHIS